MGNLNKIVDNYDEIINLLETKVSVLEQYHAIDTETIIKLREDYAKLMHDYNNLKMVNDMNKELLRINKKA